MSNKQENIVDGLALLKVIANKEADPVSAKEALDLFVGYSELKLLRYAQVQARALGYSNDDAFEAVQCSFVKVWRHAATFDIKKSHSKNEENAILMWLKSIAAKELIDFVKKGVCSQHKKEEDFSVIENAEDYVNNLLQHLDPDTKVEYITRMNAKLARLSEKQRIVYLTYLAYETRSRRLPDRLAKKLQERLDLPQVTLRVYKKRAKELMNQD